MTVSTKEYRTDITGGEAARFFLLAEMTGYMHPIPV